MGADNRGYGCINFVISEIIHILAKHSLISKLKLSMASQKYPRQRQYKKIFFHFNLITNFVLRASRDASTLAIYLDSMLKNVKAAPT